MLVVGAGPAGAELGRCLAKAGVDVCVIDRLPDLRRAAFSSAAMPMAAVEEFGLPAQVVGSRWTSWNLLGPSGQWRAWQQQQPLGVVLDFGALRCWLSEQLQAWGGCLQLGWTALGSESAADGGVITHCRDASGARRSIRSDWLIDASGQQRALIGDGALAPDPMVSGVGLEWLLQVNQQQWLRWQGSLSFVLGSQWVPQGYGWVFPMQPGVLKLGVCRLLDPRRPQPGLQTLQQQLLAQLDLANAEVLDRHGGLMRSRIRRQDCHGRGRLVALGDAVSTGNLLGGEGIRHAMTSARVLASLLQHPQADLTSRYRKALRQQLGWRWTLSGRLARRTWLGLHSPKADQRLEHWLRALERCSAVELSALLFDYRFERFGWRALPYVLGLGR